MRRHEWTKLSNNSEHADIYAGYYTGATDCQLAGFWRSAGKTGSAGIIRAHSVHDVLGQLISAARALALADPSNAVDTAALA